MKGFAVSLGTDAAFMRAWFTEKGTTLDHQLLFDLPGERLPEFVVCVRYTLGTIHQKVLRCQFQTNLGRCSKFFGEASTLDGAEVYTEVYADPPGNAITEVKVASDGKSVVLQTTKAPKTKPLRRRSFLGLLMSGVSTLKEESGAYPSVMKQAKTGKLTKRLPLDRPPLLSSKPSLLRLMMQESVPSPLFEMLTKRGNTYDATLMDLMVLHEPNASIASLACETSPILRTSVIRACLRPLSKKRGSLARLMLTPNFDRGDRSIMQLLTDDEQYDSFERPSIMRMMLFSEDQKDSVMRLLLLKNPTLLSSIAEVILEESPAASGRAVSQARSTLESNSVTGRLARFLTDSPITGKPALGKYLFAGGKNSIARKTLLGETEGGYSLLRLLLTRHPRQGSPFGFEPSVAEVLAKNPGKNNCSLLDQMIQDNELGINLARITFETTLRVKNGRVETFVHQEAVTPSLLQNGSVLSDSGCTLAHLFLAGETENHFSMLRALLIGEVLTDRPEKVSSILRLMCQNNDDGKPNMLQIVLQELLELFGSRKTHTVQNQQRRASQTGVMTNSFQPQAFIPVVLKISNRLRQMGPDFAAQWRASWQYVAEQISKSVNSNTSSDEWKRIGPLWAKICIAIGKRKWSQCFLKFSRIATILDKGHGNRFMMSQHMVSSVAKAGVSTYFGISKGIVNVVSKSISIPVASVALDGVHEILSIAEGITQKSIDVATQIGVGATGLAVQMKKKSSTASHATTEDDDDDFESDDDDVEEKADEPSMEEELLDAVRIALSSAGGVEEEDS